MPRAVLQGRVQGDARKVWIAQRLWAETSVTLKWMAAALPMGTWAHLANHSQNAKKGKPTDDQDELGLV